MTTNVHQFGSRARVVSLLYYGGLASLLLLIMSGLLRQIIPAGLATRIGHDSEGFFIALCLAAWIQFGHSRVRNPTRLRLALGLAVAMAAVGLALTVSSLPTWLTTLDEGCYALAVLIPYAALRRPIGRWPYFASVGLAIVVALSVAYDPGGESPVVILAESTMAWILAPWAFDLFNRRVLEPGVWVGVKKQLVGYLIFIAVPVTVVLLGTGVRSGEGVTGLTLDYLGRSQESFLGLVFVSIFLGTVLPWARKGNDLPIQAHGGGRVRV